jgi:hypothetical protein
MDFQTRKLNLITYLAQLQDEAFFGKLEKYILKRESEQHSELKPFTIDELISRIEKSELDFKNGKIKSQKDVEKLSSNW